MPAAYASGSWRPKAGEEDAFVAAWTEFARWISTMDGVDTPHLLRDANDPGHYMSYSRWRDADAMNAWRNNPEFPERMGRVRAHVDEFTPSDYELVAEVAPQPA
jgi:heme-degrading monooxygenase HmoA